MTSIIAFRRTFDGFNEVHALVLHISYQFVGHQHVNTLGTKEEYRMQSIVRQAQRVQQFVHQRAAGQTFQIGDSPKRAVVLHREVQRQLRGWWFRVQRVEQSNTIGQTADLDQVVSGESQDVRSREA